MVASNVKSFFVIISFN